MKKIAILYICTGRYTVFWKGFYQSAEAFFLTEYARDYFVFTDGNLESQANNVNIIYQESLGWPHNTLMRFDMFKRIIDQLKEFDYIYFFNANIIFLEPIRQEFLPEKEGLLAVIHPGFYKNDRENYVYETNPESTAYIGDNEGEYYFMGGVNGGRSKDYIELIINIAQQIDDDLKNNLIAIWHDESQLNKYLLNRNVKILPSSYGYPEGWNLPLEKKILILEKGNFGGHDFLRNEKSKIWRSLLNIFSKQSSRNNKFK